MAARLAGGVSGGCPSDFACPGSVDGGARRLGRRRRGNLAAVGRAGAHRRQAT